MDCGPTSDARRRANEWLVIAAEVSEHVSSLDDTGMRQRHSGAIVVIYRQALCDTVSWGHLTRLSAHDGRGAITHAA